MVQRCQPDCLAHNNKHDKQKSRFRLESLLTTRHPYFLVLAARKTYLITARARKNKHTARMLASARKDHSIPLITIACVASVFEGFGSKERDFWCFAPAENGERAKKKLRRLPKPSLRHQILSCKLLNSCCLKFLAPEQLC